MAKVVTKEAKQFYAMLALLKCAKVFSDYLLQMNGVHGDVKNELKGLFNRFKIFQENVTKGMPADDRKLWETDWNRDYLSFSAVFEIMSDLNDEQREILEQFASELQKGNIEVDLKKTA
jgi:hypothetical protein